ncbi:NOS [Symbiodinium sp. CCMP2592]|nr:NOS [Symbiodinium sp. CCMP2592]
MSQSKAFKARLVADPSVGVSDLEKVLTTFLDEVVKQGKIDMMDFVLRPSGINWKSACSPPWLVRLSPLLKLYLGVARNGVIPTKKHKQAIESVTAARSLNTGRKVLADFVDLIDDSIRCALSHLRGLMVSEAKARAFRRMDRMQQETIQGLLDLLSPSEGDGPEEGHAEVGASGSSHALVPANATEDRSLPERRASTSSFCSLGSLGSASDSVDPAKIFERILNQKDSNESQKSFGSVAAPAARIAATPSPEKGFLPGLLKDAGLDSELSAGDLEILDGCKKQQPPSKPKPKAKNGKKGGSTVAGKKAAAAAVEPPAVDAGAKSGKKGGSTVAGKKAAAAAVEPPAVDAGAKSRKRAYVPDEELDRTTLRKRVVSRAYHRTADHALAMGKSKEDAKKRARKAAGKAGQKFDQEHPRESKAKKSQADKIPQKKSPDGSPDGTVHPDSDGTIPKTRIQADGPAKSKKKPKHGESTIPKISEGTNPKSEGTIPKSDSTVPNGDGTIPDADSTNPVAEGTIPDADGTNPVAEGTNPDADSTNPDSDDTIAAEGKIPPKKKKIPKKKIGKK